MTSEPTQATEQSADPLSLAMAVSPRVELERVVLLTSLIRRVDDDRLTDGLKLVHNFTMASASIKDHPPSIEIRLAFKLEVANSGVEDLNKKGHEHQLFIGAMFSLVYSLDNLEGITEANVNAFGATNGVYNAWPYWREYVQSVSVRMGLPAIVAPVFRFPSVASIPKQTREAVDETI